MMWKSRPFSLFPALPALFGTLALLAVAAAAQEVPSKNLRLLQEIPIRMPSSSPLLPGAAQCDNNGALYFRVSQSGALSSRVDPVIKVSSTGFPSQTYSLSPVPGYDLSTTASVSDFIVTGDGQVYFLASKDSINGPDPELALIHFSSGARYLETLKLAHFFLPRRAAVLPGGSFFLLALDRDGFLSPQSRQFVEASFVYPVGLFFGLNGKLLREIALPDTTTPTPSAVAIKAGGPPASSDPAFVAAAYDGTIYVMRQKPDLALYVISDSGATVDSITITPPFPKAVVVGIAPAGPAKFAVEFARRTGDTTFDDSHAVFSVIDAEIGERLVDYQASPETSGVLGCPTPVGFELLSRQAGGKLAIRFVGAK